MKKLIILFVVLLCCKVLPAQQNDSIKIVKYLEKIDSLWSNDSNYEAIKEINRLMPLVVKRQGKLSDEYGALLEKVSQIYYENGELDHAIQIIEERLQLLFLKSGDKTKEYANALSLKALFLAGKGKSTDALVLFDVALDILQNTAPNSIEYARTLKDCSIALYDLGNFEKALEYTKTAHDIITSNHKLTDSDWRVISIEKAYSSLLFEIGKINESINIDHLIVAKLDSCLCNPSLKAYALMGLSLSYQEINDFESCIKYGMLADSIFSTLNKNSGTNLGTIKMYIGMGYEGLKNNKKAEEYYLSSLSLRESSYGYSHPYTIGTLSKLLYLYHKNGNTEKVISSLKSIAERKGHSIIDTFAKLDSESQKQYWYQYESDWFLTILPAYSAIYNQAEINGLVYDGLLLSKSIILDSEVQFNQFLKSNINLSYYQHYIQIKQQISNASGSKLDSLQREERAFRTEILSKTDYMDIFKTTWKDVRSSLNDNSVAIEFMCAPKEDESVQYYALILHKHVDSPILVELFNSKELNKLLPHRYYTSTILSKMLWEPIISKLPIDTKTIYFSPIGDLYNISIENLPNPDGAGYLSDDYNLFRLTSTRYLTKRSDANFIVSATLFGGMNYDTISVINMTDTHYIEHYSQLTKNQLRDGYENLPGTLLEINNVKKELQNIDINVVDYKGIAASKQAFLFLPNNIPSILHIATHGFFYSNKDKHLFRTGEAQNLSEDELILLQSGLLFSGANRAIRKNEPLLSPNSGVMTAYEISKMDLQNLNLVVLSACQTGLGEIKGDGVFGLQRGFKMAGVNSIMMSLWKVDDDATQMLMSLFYRNYASGMSIHSSLEEAKREVRNFVGSINGVKRNFSNPRYWAAFVLLDSFE
ncbi:CHAT domain-containing protein [Parabacteroides distasonis]|nr:CHAT domain-containing protein [Parabacteroides distasonis]